MPNEIYFDDRWFSGVKKVEEAVKDEVDYFRLAKTTQKGFCLSTLEKLMK